MMFSVDELEDSIQGFGADDFYWKMKDQWRPETVILGNLGGFRGVAEYGGEGQGEDFWVVFKHLESGRLFRKSGYYSSYDGGYFDGDLEEVEAYEKVVTDYRPVS